MSSATVYPVQEVSGVEGLRALSHICRRGHCQPAEIRRPSRKSQQNLLRGALSEALISRLCFYATTMFVCRPPMLSLLELEDPAPMSRWSTRDGPTHRGRGFSGERQPPGGCYDAKAMRSACTESKGISTPTTPSRGYIGVVHKIAGRRRKGASWLRWNAFMREDMYRHRQRSCCFRNQIYPRDLSNPLLCPLRWPGLRPLRMDRPLS